MSVCLENNIESKDEAGQLSINKSQEKKKEKNQHPDFDETQCKVCFNAESTMINKVCRHLLICE
jgi:hypothetical protein